MMDLLFGFLLGRYIFPKCSENKRTYYFETEQELEDPAVIYEMQKQFTGDYKFDSTKTRLRKANISLYLEKRNRRD